MSRLSRLRQARQHLQNTPPPAQALPPPPGQPQPIGLEQLVPILMQQGAPIQYRVDVCAEPPLVRIAAKCGPLEIPLDLDLAKAEALLDSLDQAIDRISPKNGDETVEVTVESEPLADDLAALLTQARANVEARAAERGLILGT